MRLSDVSNLAIATDSADGVFADGKFVVQLGEGKCRNDGLKPFSPKLFLIVAKMSLPKRSAPYWSNPLSSIFLHSGTLVLSPERQSDQMSKRVGIDQYGLEHFEV